CCEKSTVPVRLGNPDLERSIGGWRLDLSDDSAEDEQRQESRRSGPCENSPCPETQPEHCVDDERADKRARVVRTMVPEGPASHFSWSNIGDQPVAWRTPHTLPEPVAETGQEDLPRHSHNGEERTSDCGNRITGHRDCLQSPDSIGQIARSELEQTRNRVRDSLDH